MNHRNYSADLRCGSSGAEVGSRLGAGSVGSVGASCSLISRCMSRCERSLERMIHHCQRPALGPFREAIVAGLSGALGLGPGLVGLKFKTAEGLGAVGRSLAVSAWALVSVETK